MSADVPSGFPELWERYPWPDSRPFEGVPTVGRNSSGFDLILDAVRARQEPTVIMEIGAEFGGSTRRFLELPDTWVVSVDPWPDTYGSGSFPELDSYLDRPDAMFDVFRSLCWDLRDRIATVREFSPLGPRVVYDAGVKVDFVYVDGDHRYDAVFRDLTVAKTLFPQAVICGDDWCLKSLHPKYEGMYRPVRRALASWGAFHGLHVESSHNSWMIDPARPYNYNPPPSRFSGAASSFVDVDRAVRRVESKVTTPSRTGHAIRKVRKSIRRAINR